MKDCEYGTPEKLARYFDNTMNEEEKHSFEKHLMVCKSCMEALLSLEKDIFLMQNAPFHKLPRNLRMKNAIFNLSDGGLELLKNIIDLYNFSPVLYAPARGKDINAVKSYILRKNNFSLEIVAKDKRNFLLEINGKSLYEIRIYRNKLLIDAIVLSGPENVTIENLKPGSYTVWINDEEFADFEVR